MDKRKGQVWNDKQMTRWKSVQKVDREGKLKNGLDKLMDGLKDVGMDGREGGRGRVGEGRSPGECRP